MLCTILAHPSVFALFTMFILWQIMRVGVWYGESQSRRDHELRMAKFESRAKLESESKSE